MKKIIIWVLAIACLLTLAGCSRGDAQKGPAFPLEKQEVEAAVAELSLPWVIFDEETQQISDANRKAVIYTLRDPEKKHSEDPDSLYLFCAGILTGTLRGHRELDMTLVSRWHGLEGTAFAWEDWKQEIILATMLYGGMDREEAYQALSKLEVPDEDIFELGVPLSNGYCMVKKKATEQGSDHYSLWIHFWESEELYREARTPKS